MLNCGGAGAALVEDATLELPLPLLSMLLIAAIFFAATAPAKPACKIG
jgi:hypothetical protein